MQDAALWSRISACHPDDVDAALPFSRRLARDNAWTVGYASRVITEYQRFAYLSFLGRGMVTPSDEVDQAWHLHLTYTKHYWGPFKAALGGALHHMPTRGGEQQASYFEDTYEKTLALYREEFGEPPADIWPPSKIRFGRAPHYTRINRQDVWLLPKPDLTAIGKTLTAFLKRVPARFTAGLALTAIILAGIGVAVAHDGTVPGDTTLEKARNMVWHWATQHTFTFVVVIVVAALAIRAVLFGSGGSNTGSGCSSGCSSSDSGCSGGSGCGGCGGGGD